MKIIWFGSFPAHYMSNFHVLLESKFSDVFFLYTPPERRGIEFSHEVLTLPKNHLLLPSKWAFFKAWQSLNRINPRAVLIAGNYPRINLLAAAWAHIHKKELFYLCDSNALDIKNMTRRRINTFFLKRFLSLMTKLLSIGSRNTEFYNKVCGVSHTSSRIHHFPLPHCHESFAKNSCHLDSTFTFLVLCRLVEVKAVDRVLYAFSKLSLKDQKQSSVVIAGDGPLRNSLEKLSIELKINDRIKFLGSVSSNETPNIFAMCNIVIISSHQEPWGLVANESLSSGKPVIAPYWVGACEDLIKNYKTGLILSTNSSDKICEAMEYCLENPQELKAMGDNGQRLIRDGEWNIIGSLNSFSKLIDFLK